MLSYLFLFLFWGLSDQPSFRSFRVSGLSGFGSFGFESVEFWISRIQVVYFFFLSNQVSRVSDSDELDWFFKSDQFLSALQNYISISFSCFLTFTPFYLFENEIFLMLSEEGETKALNWAYIMATLKCQFPLQYIITWQNLVNWENVFGSTSFNMRSNTTWF